MQLVKQTIKCNIIISYPSIRYKKDHQIPIKKKILLAKLKIFKKLLAEIFVYGLAQK
jgi:hypothetical protein